MRNGKIDRLSDFDAHGLNALWLWLQAQLPETAAFKKLQQIVGHIDSTENVGLPWGVQSVESDSTLEAEGLVLLADGDGGSLWGNVGQRALGYAEIIAGLPGNYAYYKLPETVGNYVDSGGAGGNLTPNVSALVTRGVPGVVHESDGELAVDCSGFPSPGPGLTNSYCGVVANSFFAFNSGAPFSVLATIKPNGNINQGTLGYRWGICGTSNLNIPGWGIFASANGGMKIIFGRNDGTIAHSEQAVTSTSSLAINTVTQIMCVFDGTTYKIYWNGALDSTSTPGTLYAPTGCGTNFKIGGLSFHEGIGGIDAPWCGMIDSVLVADGDLSDYAFTLYQATDGTLITSGPITGIDTHGIPEGMVPVADGVTDNPSWEYPVQVTY